MADELRIRFADQGDADLANELGNSIKAALAEQGKGKWLGTSAGWIGNKAVEAIDGAIGGIDLLQVFGAAWTTAHTLRERADPDKYPWDTPQYVKLGEHTVNFDVKPQLIVSVAGWDSKPIELAMGLSAVINAVELKLKAGHIVSLCGGSCDLGVEIKLGGQAIMKRKTLKTLKLDMEHRFREPGLSLTSRQPAPAT